MKIIIKNIYVSKNEQSGFKLDQIITIGIFTIIYLTIQGISRMIMSPTELKMQPTIIGTFATPTWIFDFNLKNVKHS
jgi:hypothetical protein